MRKAGGSMKGFLCGVLLTSLCFVFLGAGPGGNGQEYVVRSYQEAENLEKWVKAQLKEGWKPIGGVAIAYVKYSDGKWGLHHSQAMVK